MKIKLLGLGHSMRGDDEIGLIIVQRWIDNFRSDYPDEEIEAVMLESPGINLLSEVAGQDAVLIVDAVQSGAPAGTLFKLTEEDLASFDDGSGSAHGWGAAETLSLGHQLIPEDLPQKVYVIGVEAIQFKLGEGLSPALRIAIPGALKMINQVLDDLLGRGTIFMKLFRRLKSIR